MNNPYPDIYLSYHSRIIYHYHYHHPNKLANILSIYIPNSEPHQPYEVRTSVPCLEYLTYLT